MKKIISCGALMAVVMLPVTGRADFNFDLNASVPNPGLNFANTTGTGQDNWTIDDGSDSFSFLTDLSAAGRGTGAALGSFFTNSDNAVVNLTRSLDANEPLSGQTFKVDFAIINRFHDGNPANDIDSATDPDDSFAITLKGTNGFTYNLNITPPIVEDDLRNVSMTGLTSGTGIISASDGAQNLSLYNLSIAFTDNGGDLDYVAKITSIADGVFSGFTGSLAGFGAESLNEIGARFIANGGDASNEGYNYLIVDNFSMADTPPPVPEGSTAALAMLAMGAVGMRRRR